MKTVTPTDAIGWTSTAVLLATIGRQVFSQWKSKATAFVFLLFSMLPCGIALSGTTTTDDQAIREVVRRWDGAWNAHDMKAMGRLLAENADFVNIAGLHWKGRSQIELEHAERHKTNLKDSVSVTRHVEVQILSPAIALVHIDWGMTGDRDFDGTPRSPREGIFTWVMEKKDGEWLIRAAQNTNTAPRK